MNKVPEYPQRARVRADSGFVLGQFVGVATVYVIEMPDGSFVSNTLAKVRPTNEEVAQSGGVLKEIKDNPEIVLDTGEVVYGCQVWWEPVPELN